MNLEPWQREFDAALAPSEKAPCSRVKSVDGSVRMRS